jgi:hypothetical protein
MSSKLAAGVAVFAVGAGLLPVTFGTAPVHAAPYPLSPCSNCLPGPGGGPGGQGIGGPGPSVLPVTGGGPKTGHPSVRMPGPNTATPVGN